MFMPIRLARWLGSSEPLLLLQKTWVQVLSIHMAAHNHLHITPVLRNQTPSSGLQVNQAHTVYILTCRQNTYTHNIKVFKEKKTSIVEGLLN